MSPRMLASVPGGRITPTARVMHIPTLVQAKLDSQGRIQQKTPTSQVKEKQTEHEKEMDLLAKKRPVWELLFNQQLM
jgi:hypothetical protein